MSVSRFAQELKYWRKTQLLSQDQLAARAGYSVSTIRKLEAGVLRPSRVIAQRLAETLDLPPSERVRFLESSATLPQRAEAVPDQRREDVQYVSLRLLPVEETRLVGREMDLQVQLQSLLLPHVRLLTLTGTAGVGKTRLSIAVAGAAQPHFPDGVVFVSLSHLRDPELVVSTITQRLRLPMVSGQSPAAQLVSYLKDKCLLLVLDNFEHVLEAVPFVTEALAAAPGLKVMTTSRISLGLPGEHIHRVLPLLLPPQSATPSLAMLQAYPATALFLQCMWAVQPNVELSLANISAIGEICRKLDGLPLAIELAATRSRLYSPPELLELLETQLPALKDDHQDLSTRHPSLYDAINWSYMLLDDATQIFFARLAVFTGSWTADAAQQICDLGHDLPWSAVDGLILLLDHSLIRLIRTDDDLPRYAMLQTLQQFAEQRLTERREEQRIRDQHLAYYLALAELAAKHYNRADETVWLDILEQEHSNLWSAAEWARNQEVTETALQFGGFLGHYWMRRGYWHSSLQWLAATLERSRGPITSSRLGALESAMILAGKVGDFTTIQHWAEETLRTAQELGSLRGEAQAYYYLAAAAHANGNIAVADNYLGLGLALYTKLEDDIGIALIRYHQWRLAAQQGKINAGVAYLEETVARMRAVGNKAGLAQALNDLGAVRAEVEGNVVEAEALTEEGLALFREVRDVWGTCYALRNLGEVLVAQGKTPEARRLFEESLAIARCFRHQAGIAVALYELGNVAVAEGSLREARELFEESLRIGQVNNDSWVIGDALRMLGHLASLTGDQRAANEYYRDSLQRFWSMRNVQTAPVLLLGLAWCYARQAPEWSAQLLSAVEDDIRSPDFGMGLVATDRVVINMIGSELAPLRQELRSGKAGRDGRTMVLEQLVAEVVRVVMGK